jgi:hypothetical protein
MTKYYFLNKLSNQIIVFLPHEGLPGLVDQDSEC